MPDPVQSQHAALAQSTNPSYTPGQFYNVLMDPTTGALKVYIAGGGAAGGTSQVDQSAFTAGATSGTPIMAENGTQNVVLSADASRNLNVNVQAGSISTAPVYSHALNTSGQLTVGTATGTVVLAQYLSRVGFSLQNDGTTNIYILFGGSGVSNANYTVCLPAGGFAHDGSSPLFLSNQWQGSVYAASSAAGGSIVFAEYK